MRNYRTICLSSIFLLLSASSHACQVVEVGFTGVVTEAISASFVDPQIMEGSPVTGSFTYSLRTVGENTDPTIQTFQQSSIQDLQVTVAEVNAHASGEFRAVVRISESVDDVDQFAFVIIDGNEGLQDSTLPRREGDTIFVDGVQEDGVLAVGFFNGLFELEFESSGELPTVSELNSLPLQEAVGALFVVSDDLASGDILSQIVFSADSLAVSQVPEPGSFCFAVLVLGHLWVGKPRCFSDLCVGRGSFDAQRGSSPN